MGLFTNPQKELDATLEGLLLNFGGNNGNRQATAVVERVAKAETLIDRLVAKGKAAETRLSIKNIAGQTPEPVGFFRGGQAEYEAAKASLAERSPSDAVVEGWAGLCAALLERAGG
jgi:hypothetical protein